MYVKAYLDLSVKSLVFFWLFASWPVHLGAWPGGSWLPWRAAPVLWFCGYVLVWFLRDFCRNGPVFRFTFSTDRAILAIRQTQEKKSRIPAEGCFEHEKIAKNHQFLTFFRDFRSFFLSRKNGRIRQNESSAQFSGHFRAHQKRKKPSVFDTRPLFSLRGVKK